jgi:sugar/nucleoside kinase (ribokinase family)
MKRHVLVIGDLYIDHDIFVTELESRFDSGVVELCFNVLRRQDTAGGAANSARILSVLSEGETYLWGVVGSSHWGTFRGILEKSHAIDGANRPIELRGIRDESDPPMNTVTRILVVGEDEPQVVQRRFSRYYDLNHVHVADSKRETLLYHLDHIYEEKAKLHAIVINDFERRALTKDLIEVIAKRAARYRVPLFVDPRYDRTRYAGIKATAILPNIDEWCELVGDVNGADYWRRNLNEADALREMAVRSFRYLGNFEYHVVKCDRDGAVLFFPHPEKKHAYALYRIAPVELEDSSPKFQMGCGDVLTAVFALEFPKPDPTPNNVLRAFQRANAAVACYREMPWHQMPRRKDVEKKQKKFDWSPRPPDAEIAKGVLFLPEAGVIDMVVCETAIKGLFSQDQTFKTIMIDFLKDITDEWTPGSLRSVVLGAPPGTGKTTIMKAVSEIGLSHGIETMDMTSTEGAGGLHTILPAEFRERFRQLQEARKDQRLLIVVDEALREPTFSFLKENAPTLLNAAHAEGLRFLFASAAFNPELEDVAEWREFFRRLRPYYLSNLEERPFDIPYIIAARFFEQKTSLMRLEIDGDYLLAVTDLALLTPEPSMVCDVVDETLKQLRACEEYTLKVTLDKLPSRYKKKRSMPKGDFGSYEFRR